MEMEKALDTVTILAAKKKLIPISKDELFMSFQGYQSNPCSWPKIIQHMRDSGSSLPDDVKELHSTTTFKQLKLRLSAKLARLMSTTLEKIQDSDLRYGIVKIKDMEIRLSSKPNPTIQIPEEEIMRAVVTQVCEVLPTELPQTDELDNVASGVVEEVANVASSSTSKDEDMEMQGTRDAPDNQSSRQNLLANVSSEEQDVPKPPKKKKKTQKKKKISTIELARSNQLAYQKFMSKKVPKILKSLGIESDSDSDSD